MHYRANVHGTVSATATDILRHIQQWVNEGAVLTVDLLLLRVDNTCAVAIPSITYSSDGCESSAFTMMTPDEPIQTSQFNTFKLIVILVTILSVIIALLVATITVVSFLAFKRHYHTKNITLEQHGPVSTV